MNKKGFTLIELLIVITLMAIIMVIAVPNIINLIERSKKESFVADAENLISKAKYKYNLDAYQDLFITINSDCKEIIASNLDFNVEKDPDGNNYDKSNSKVKVCIESSKKVFYVKTITSLTGTNEKHRGVFDSSKLEGYVKESDLSKESVNDMT